MGLIFDDIERSDDRPKENQEADYEFYNRSSWPEMQLVRDLLDDLISRYPDSEQGELIASKKPSPRQYLFAGFPGLILTRLIN